MTRFAMRLLLGLWSGAFLLSEAKAQSGRRGEITAPVGGMTNPYMNPYTNPYLNPALTVGNSNRNDTMLYLWAAQQQPGGLLGRRVPASASASRPAEMPKSAMQPAGSATRYFGRSPAEGERTSGLGKQYQRFNRYYSHNGR